MPAHETEAAYFMRRAREETRLALTAGRPDVASAHHGLAIQYSSRARSAFPQLAPAGQPRGPAKLA
jgi:hypothetical protein